MAKNTTQDEIKLASVQSEEADSEAPLQPYEILSYPADYTLELLVDKWTKGDIESPKLQRRYIWPIARASKLIESFLLGLPVPPIFFYQDNENKLLIVDGHQRIRSIAYFFSGWFGEADDPDREPFKLTGLHEKSQFAGVDIDRLKKDTPSLNRLKNSVLRAFIMKQLHPKKDDSSILAVFERLNTGGMVLQGQEIRNCVYTGKFNESLKKLNGGTKELNGGKDWRKIVGTQTADKRMRDVELILRFFALFYNLPNYEKPMKVFLNHFMRVNRYATDDRRKELEGIFEKTAQAVVKYLGSKPFHILRGLNAAVFDSVFTAFARNLEKMSGKATASHINHVNAQFEKLLKDKHYIKLISAATTDKDVVPKRLNRAEKFLFG